MLNNNIKILLVSFVHHIELQNFLNAPRNTKVLFHCRQITSDAAQLLQDIFHVAHDFHKLTICYIIQVKTLYRDILQKPSHIVEFSRDKGIHKLHPLLLDSKSASYITHT